MNSLARSCEWMNCRSGVLVPDTTQGVPFCVTLGLSMGGEYGEVRIYFSIGNNLWISPGMTCESSRSLFATGMNRVSQGGKTRHTSCHGTENVRRNRRREVAPILFTVSPIDNHV